MNTKQQLPSKVVDGKIVNWKIIANAFGCFNQHSGKCSITRKDCCFDLCPDRVRGSFEETNLPRK